MLFTNKDLRKLIIPLLVEQLLLRLVGIIDTVMVSSVGEVAISGVSLVNEINNLMITLLGALAGGGAVVVSQYLGYGDKERSRLSAGQLILVALVVSSALGAVGLIGRRVILGALYKDIEVDVMRSAITYLAITALSVPFLGVYDSVSALFRSMNETKVTMYISVLMNMINIIGNYIGVYVLKTGVSGVAWATTISRIVACLIILILAFGQHREIALLWQNIFTCEWNIISKILTIAIPNSVENSLFHLGRILVAAFVAGYGTSQLAANGVANSLFELLVTASLTMQLAIVTVIGQCVGVDDYEQTRFYFKKMTKISYVMMFVNALLVVVALSHILKLYSLTAETSVLVTQIIISCAIFAILFHTPAWVLPNGLRAAGDASFTMVIGIASMFLFRVLGSYLFGTVFGFGVLATWFAMYADWIVRSVCYLLRYRSGKWTKYRLIES